MPKSASNPFPKNKANRGDFTLSSHGVWLKNNWTDATFYFCCTGFYSSLLSEYIDEQSEHFIFIDIGANQGLFSLLAARQKHCDLVLAFEPVQKTFSLLCENIRVNHNPEIIKAFQLAISEEDATRDISTRTGHSGAATLRESTIHLFRGAETIQTVGPKTLRQLIPPRQSIIKIDVEGHEKAVMRTLAQAGCLSQSKAVYYEVDTRWTNPEELKAILTTYGFTQFRQTGCSQHYDVLATRRN